MKREDIVRAARTAFPYTIPILAGFLFVGIAYGIFMRSLGFSAWYPILISVLVFAGSMQFVLGNLLTQPFDPLNALILTLLVNARHLFYGISLLGQYQNLGAKRWYLMFGLCDETFSVNVSVEVPEGVDRGWFYFFITLFDNLYWILGTALGALFGSFLTFDTKGILFVMTALFLVIFTTQWMRDTNHLPALSGVGISLCALLLVGAEHFVPVSMLGILLVLTLLRPYLEGRKRI